MLKPTLASIKLTCFKTDVYEPSDDSFLLADSIASLSKTWSSSWPKIAIEVGCGTGYVICSLALTLHSIGNKHVKLFATDINPSAAIATQTTLRAHSLENSVDIAITDLVSSLQPHMNGMVDLLVFNPPYVCTPDEEVSMHGISAAWAGGHRGRRVIDRMLPCVDELLSPDGELVMIALDENDPQELIDIMNGKGFKGEIIAQRAADEEHLHVLYFKRL